MPELASGGPRVDSKSNEDVVLCFNAASSALRFNLFRIDAYGEHRLASGVVSKLGAPQACASLDLGPANG
jgi:acetate kinase